MAQVPRAWRDFTVWLSGACAGVLVLPVAVPAQPEMIAAWNKPQAPFRIAGNLHYVGTSELGAYLITTPEGHVLIDGGFDETAPLILASIRTLGFRPEDLEVLLTTQAHMDHVGSMAALKKATGARIMVMEQDAGLVESGGKGDFAAGDTFRFPPAAVDRRLKDGDTVAIGGSVLRATLTPGHTKGCTTWTTTVTENGRSYRVIFAGSLSVNPTVRLVEKPSYPGIADDYRRSFATLRSIEADIFLGAHAGFFGLHEKVARLPAAGANPFVDPGALGRYVDRWEAQFNERLAKER
jgi:metallo-beta-lactamase class B